MPTAKQRAARKRYEKRHNYRTKTLASRGHSGGADGQYSKAPKFYRKEAVRQHQSWLAKLLKSRFNKQG